MKKAILLMPALLLYVYCQAQSPDYPNAGNYRLQRISGNLAAVIDLYHPSPKATVNAAFMATEKSLIFVDAGMNQDSAAAIWEEATKTFPGRTSFYLILTHFHCDHTFGMGFFKSKGAKIIGHRNIDVWLDQAKFSKRIREMVGEDMTFVDVIAEETYSNPEEARKVLGEVTLSSPDLLIDADFILKVDGKKYELLYVPGHSDDLMVVFEPESRTLIASDLIYTDGNPFLHDETKEGYEGWLKSLKRVEALPIDIIIPGHGPVGDKSAIEKNKLYLEEQRKRFELDDADLN